MAGIYRTVSILPLVARAAADESDPWRWSEMFHPAIAAAMAHERQTALIKASDRRRTLRTLGRNKAATHGRRGR